MKLSDINRETQPKTRFIVENYLIPANDRNASIDVMLLSLYMQCSRFLCWNRVKVFGMKGYEYPMLCAFNFARSGAYKDEVIRSLVNVISYPLAEQAKYKIKNYQARVASYHDKMAGLTGDDKKEYIMNLKPKRFHNTFKEGTIQALQSYRKAAEQAGIGYVHYEHDEFVDNFGMIDSNVKQILSLIKTAYQVGNSTSNAVISDWRDNVENVPITMLLHSSSDELMSGKLLLKNFLSILKTGIGKRSFILFDKDFTKKKRTDKEVEEDRQLVQNSIAEAERMFTELYCSINHSPQFEADVEIDRMRNKYLNECIDKADKVDHPIIKLEILDRSWRAFRLATCIAVFEHPENLTVLPNDYEWAITLTDNWGDQFKSFVLDENNLDVGQLYDYIKETPGIGKTQIRNKLGAGSTRDVDDAIKQIKMMADEEGTPLIESVGRGLARYYSIVDPDAVDIDKETEILAYIREMGSSELVTIDKLVARFGNEVGVVLVKHKVQRRETDSGYYITPHTNDR